MTLKEALDIKPRQLLISIRGSQGPRSTETEVGGVQHQSTDLVIRARFTWHHHCWPLLREGPTFYKVPVHANIQVIVWREFLNVGKALVKGSWFLEDRGMEAFPRQGHGALFPAPVLTLFLQSSHHHPFTFPRLLYHKPMDSTPDEVTDPREEPTAGTFLSQCHS